MRFSLTTLLFQLVNVLVLLAILRHFLFRPVADIIARRQAATDAALREAEVARAAAESARHDADAATARTEAARHDLLTSTRQAAAEQVQAMIGEARTRADEIQAEAEARAAATLAAAASETLACARDLAQTIARKALSELPDPPDVANYAERLAKTLEALPEVRRATLLAGANLRIVAPGPLGEGDRDRVLQRLGLTQVGIEADPTLIAGLDLRSDTGIVHNSLAHDLDRIVAAMEPRARHG